MKKWLKNIPDGTNDILFSKCKIKKQTERKLENYFDKIGYSQIITPGIEFFDVFYSPEIFDAQAMYKLFDNKNRLLALRADCTTPVARVAATRLKDCEGPLKLFYNQSVFRSNTDFEGKRNEVTQCGCELIGISGIKADIDIIATAAGALSAAGIENYKIEIGHVGLFKALAEESELNEDDTEIVRELIENKNLTALESFVESKGEKTENLLKLAKLFGGFEVLEKAKKYFTSFPAQMIISYIQELAYSLSQIGLKDKIFIDLGLVSSINYYTGIVFKGYTEGLGNVVLSGGRYDGLLQKFGTDRPAAGFAIDVDALVDTFKNDIEDSCDCIIFYKGGNEKQAYELLNEKIQNGVRCQISAFSTLEETEEYANANNISQVLEIGE